MSQRAKTKAAARRRRNPKSPLKRGETLAAACPAQVVQPTSYPFTMEMLKNIFSTNSEQSAVKEYRQLKLQSTEQLGHIGKLSDMTEIALQDLIAVSKMPGYRIDMGNWHTPLGNTCSVCFAGSVMVGTMGVDKQADLAATDFHQKDADKLDAMDSMRQFDLLSAAKAFYRSKLTSGMRVSAERADDAVRSMINAKHKGIQPSGDDKSNRVAFIDVMQFAIKKLRDRGL